jgi:hypothetical protein
MSDKAGAMTMSDKIVRALNSTETKPCFSWLFLLYTQTFCKTSREP